MKKITLLLLALFFSISGYSQFTPAVEGFESTAGPVASPSNNWPLATGTWLVFDNGFGTATRWGISTITTPPTQVYQGVNSAYINRQTNFSDGQTVEDYLASPLVTIPSNGQLRFWTRAFLAGNQGTVYQIKVAPANANPTDPNSYLLVQQWTDADLVANFSTFEEKAVDLSEYAGLSVRVAFVMQQAPLAAPFGDRWFVDDVTIVERCFEPTNLSAQNITQTSAQLTWNSTGSTSWEVELLPAGDNATGTGTVFNTNNPTVTTTLPANVALTPTTAYKYYVRAICANSTSEWVGPFNFSTSSPGLSCNAPITVTALPYSTTDNTSNYADNTDTQPAGCVTGTGYMAGNEVFYSYTAPANGTISISMTPTANNSSLFVYQGCANVGVTCIQGVANNNSTVRTIPNLPVVAGQTYIIVISSTAAVQTVGYTLIIQNVNCAEPTNLNAPVISQTSANLSWSAGAATTWEVVVQNAGNGVPQGSGVQTTNNTAYPTPNPLTANTPYEFYVRADCNDGSGNFSAWAGPFVFRTLCDAFTVPFQEGFNSTSTTEACWTVLNVNNDDDSWSTNDDLNPFEGDQSASINTEDFIEIGSNDDWLISPQVILTGNQRLRFRYRVRSDFEPQDFRVMLSTTGTSPIAFTETLVPLATYSNENYVERIVNLSAYSGPVNIGWHVPQGGLDGWVLYIDNVIIEDLPTCPEPTDLTSNTVLHNSATIQWTNGGSETAWQVLALPCGSPAPNATSTGFVDINPTTNSYTFPNNLTPTTCYDVYIRAVCAGNDLSPWTGPTTFTTQVAPPECGGTYTDPGGPNGQYANNENSTVTICPPTGQLVTVTFTSFDIETSWDALYVYDGNSVAAPQISSENGTGNVPGGIPGGFWGTTIPGPFTSSSADGCLTFMFISDGFVQANGWVANVVCEPIPTCPKPTNVNLTNITQNSATVNWTEVGTATQWEVLVLPFGSPIPNGNSIGGQIVDLTTQYLLTPLNSGTAYTVYVRAICSSSDISNWSNGKNFTTLIANDECSNAINVTVNSDTSCTQFASGTLIGATGSSQPNTCFGTDDDDVWFSFVATATAHSIDLTNITGSTQDLFHVVYSGNCNNLIQLTCNDNNSSTISNLIIGNTYFIRVYSWTSTPNQTSTFNVCIGTIPPPISTSTTLYTVNQLVENVLLNSTCAIISNITFSTGTNFNSTNGIGYFNQNNSSFSFEDGVILSTGNVSNAPGPNDEILGDGAFGWPGDTDLEAIVLAATGEEMDSNNATKLEFDFIPVIDTINFNFIFASEEYGTFQCDYSDAFAFLLTDVSTGITTNLAVLPNTNTPVSVVTIRDDQFNDNCSSANEQYFDTFYGLGGDNPLGAPINFNGVTVPLTASSSVIPGNLYHIKLVIADRLDTNYDSAVFIEGGSFDIGNIDLGDDLLQSTNNAVCFGDTKTLDSGLDASLFTFTWLLNNEVIPNQTNSTLTVNEPGNYTLSVLYNNSTCTASDTITVEFYPELFGGEPVNLSKCSLSNSAEFDLTYNTTLILNGLDSTHSVKYYLSIEDAQNNVNEISNPSAFDGINQQIIYYSLINAGNCRINGEFILNVTPLTEIIFNLPTEICQNSSVPILPNISNNNISGTWEPSLVSNLQTQTYTFTASDTNLICTEPYEITIVVNENITPSFLSPAPICNGDIAPILPTTSNNGIIGTWSPEVVDNTQTQTYTFTPSNNSCAQQTQLVVEVLQNCAFGSFANAVWLTNCETSNFFNTVGSGTSIIGPIENIFPNTYFGTYVSNSNTFKLRGAELKTFKINSANVCSATLFYRIYPVSGTGGTFSSIPLQFFDDCNSGSFPSGGPCSTGDQKWQEVLTDIENPIDLTAFPAGDYQLEVYYEIVGDISSNNQCDDTLLVNNNGANFIATYSLQSNLTFSETHPTICNASNGSITISGLNPLTNFGINYTVNGNSTNANVTSNSNGEVILSNLNAGLYSNFIFTFNGCTQNYTETITLVNPTITPTFNIPSYCSGVQGVVLPIQSLEGITGQWNIPFNSNQTTTYIFNPDSNQCGVAVEVEVVINQPIQATFNPITFCEGNVAPSFPTTSIEGFTGTWSASEISNLVGTANYIFTPSSELCASQGILVVSVTARTLPVFDFGTQLNTCQNAAANFTLPSLSSNGINGSWLPAIVDYNLVGTTSYVFTPNNSECALQTTYSVTINATVTPTFTAVAPICIGDTLNQLPLVSTNGIDGSWLPQLNNNETTTYTFTPNNPNSCAISVPLTIIVNQLTQSTFNNEVICNGENINFPVVSVEGFNGIWSPSIVNTTQTTNYSFTPNPGQCANTGTWTVTVLPTFDFSITQGCLNNNYTLQITEGIGVDLDNASFQWSFNNQNIGNNNISFNVTEYLASTQANEQLPLTFTVTVTDENGCSASKPIELTRIACEIQKVFLLTMMV